MKITVYSSTTCVWCTRVKEYLDSKNVQYTEVNVQEDANGAKEMVEKSGQRGVPVLDIDGNIIIGFNQDEIDKLIQE